MSEMDGIKQRIKEAFDASGLSMREASMRAGLNETYLRDLFNGRYNAISVDKLTSIAKALGKSASWLLSGEGDPTPPQGVEGAEIMSIMPRLSDKARMSLTEYARFLIEQMKREDKDVG
jgi:transcriptional regulator with XRE-family HTH domain